ncbi:MAG: hypothetical protein C0624_10155 [Desulfuromonas sp.]|nr:MAG: hypothetical protein C0624_10155 [Desulfuromonas sp.]
MKYLESLIRITSKSSDLESAVAKALQHFDCSRAEVDIQIISSGRRGWFGLGRQDAEVQVALVDRAYVARHICSNLLTRSGWRAEVSVSQSSEQIDLVIESDSTAQIIGKHGQTLEALQYLVTTVTDRACHTDIPLVLDAGGYRLKRHRYLKGLAHKLSDKVRTSGNKVTLDPLPHHERRILHKLIRDQRGVTSTSIGNGYEKRVIVTPEG